MIKSFKNPLRKMKLKLNCLIMKFISFCSAFKVLSKYVICHLNKFIYESSKKK